MTVRRFAIGQTEGVEFADGRVVLGTVPPRVFPDLAACEEVVGPVEWVDGPRPTWSTDALLSVPAPGLVGDGEELVRLLVHVTHFRAPLWTAPVVIWTCKVATPHLTAAFPWLEEAMADWPTGAPDTEVHRWAARWRAEHPGPHAVEPMRLREITRRTTALRVIAARPYPRIGSLRG